MQVLNKQNELLEDKWEFINDEQALVNIKPDQIIPLEAIDDAQLDAFDFNQNAVWLKLPEELERIAPHLARCQMLAICFPLFKNGRGFSMARRLRDEFGYKGELRAVGQVIPDQYAMLIECGFDAVALNETHYDVDVWKEAVKSVSTRYQQDSKGNFASILKQRYEALSAGN